MTRPVEATSAVRTRRLADQPSGRRRFADRRQDALF